MRIGIITEHDPRDKRSWSGIYYRMIKALEEESLTIVHLGPVKLNKLNYYMMNAQLLICALFHQVFFRKRYNRSHSHIRSRYNGKFFEKKIKKNKVDVIYAPSASVQIAHMKTDIPICYFADATFSIICNYYDSFANFSPRSIRISDEIEQRAINKSTTQVFSSKWAFDSAKLYYGSQNTFLVKMGANIDEDPNEEQLIKQYDSCY